MIGIDKYYEINGQDAVSYEQPKVNKKHNKKIVITETTNENFNNPKVEEAEIKQVVWRDKNLNNVCYWVLKSLIEISETRFYGVNMLAQVLLGLSSETIRENNFDKLNTYGVYKDIDFDDIKIIIQFLIDEGYIIKTGQMYPVLHISSKGIDYKKNMDVKTLKKLKKNLG